MTSDNQHYILYVYESFTWWPVKWCSPVPACNWKIRYGTLVLDHVVLAVRLLAVQCSGFVHLGSGTQDGVLGISTQGTVPGTWSCGTCRTALAVQCSGLSLVRYSGWSTCGHFREGTWYLVIVVLAVRL